MNEEEILVEALALAEMYAGEMEKIYIPEAQLTRLLETKRLPQDYHRLRSELNLAISQIRKIMIDIHRNRKALNFLEKGELFFERHMQGLYDALKEMKKNLQEGVSIIREQTKKPLKDDRPEWVVK